MYLDGFRTNDCTSRASITHDARSDTVGRIARRDARAIVRSSRHLSPPL
jgi:hypothetical protein